MTETDIKADEGLGIGVLSARRAKHVSADDRCISFDLFLEKPNEVIISIDRPDIARPGEALKIARNVAKERCRKFYGRAVVGASRARESGRKTVPSPQAKNRLHADIVLPDRVREDRDEQKRHAKDLADCATWQGISYVDETA